MKALAKIHVAKKQLDMDEDAYRDMLQRTVGQRTSKGLSDAQCGKVLEEFRRLGFPSTSSGQARSTSSGQAPRRKLEGKYAAKLQALWIAAWNLGITRSRDDAALIAFVRRQTGIDHVRFVRDQDDATKAIEALKGWMTREAGVDWNTAKHFPAHAKLPGFRIALAQFAILKRDDPHFGQFNSLTHWMMQTGEERLGCPRLPADMTDKTWPAVMNALGEKIRATRGAV